jgi:hypothetical protein
MIATVAVPALASHPEASLPGSNFEIDEDANLKQDDSSPSIDWASVTETRQADTPSGQNDNSYSGGTKEDDACPSTTTGSIPNNKSDLLNFGVYREPGSSSSDPGYLHLFWTRVLEPNGTTLMDFELNQSSTPCATGRINPVRTGDGNGSGVDDLLIEYSIDQGGARASITVRKWTGSAWGPADVLDETEATGTINSSTIPVADADGLPGPISPRTFGEASIDLDLIFDPNKCVSFGSAFLKSRASDAFTSQLKDFIAPTPINLTNCGKVIIRKVTDPSDSPDFDFTKSFNTDPSTSNNFDLAGGESITFNNVLFGSGYTVTEDSLPAGWDFVSIDCNVTGHPSVGVTPTIDAANRKVTFTIDDPADVLDCTYSNRARGTIIVKKVADAAGSFDFTSGTLPSTAFTLTTTAAGEAGSDSQTFSNLVPGTFDVAETVPTGWNLTSATCDDGSAVSAISLQAGETVTCTFNDVRELGAIEITKTRKHAADGPGDHPHAGVTFTITGGELPAGGVTVVTDANGKACLDGLVLSSFVGDYTVTETVPSGYNVTSTNPQTVSVTSEATCSAGTKAAVSFTNMPLTNLTVSVDSQVDGGTASTIDCDTTDPDDPGSTDADGDGEVTIEDLEPGTYVCTIVIDP